MAEKQNKPACCRWHHRQTAVNLAALRTRPILFKMIYLTKPTRKRMNRVSISLLSSRIFQTVCFICRRSFSNLFFKTAMQNWVNRSEQDSTMVPNFAPAHFCPHGILLGSAFPKPCCTLRYERNMAYNAFHFSTMKEALNDKNLQHTEATSHRQDTLEQ